MIKIKKILCPVDLSENSLEALRYAIDIVLERTGITMYLVHVIDSRVFDYGGPIYEHETPVMRPVIDQSIRDKLKDKILAEVPEKIKNRVETIILFGVPFVEIIKAAREHDIDLIVLGTHGRTGLAHMLIGSVAEKVVRKAPCSVLTVKCTGNVSTP